ncbi:MAG: site-specific DNA-methyltransferase, partial [Candidatus Peribacteraceae bacterium]|nr:site-specific DNA-methyltransferase [Candidatus Peribacteraceae bacterium]
MNRLINGECLEEMDKLIDDGVVVDAIIADPPYGTTACKWDSVIPFDGMWERLNKIIKPNGAIVLFGSQPFTSSLVMSNVDMFKYELIYEKTLASNFVHSNYQPLKAHENILV